MTEQPPSAWQIGQVLAIARATTDRMARTDAGAETDEAQLFEALRSDGVEAEDIVRRLARAAIEAKAMAEAIVSRVAQLGDRSRRWEKREEEYRASLFAVMQVLALPKFIDAEFTITLRENKGGSVIVTDESALPETYWRVTRAPDKKKIADDIKEGVVVPGAELTQGGEPSVQIRAK